MDLVEAVKHPFSALLTVVGSVSYLLDPMLIEGVLVAVWSSAGSLFTFLSISTFTVPRIFPELSGLVGPLKGAFAVVLVLYLAKTGLTIYENIDRNL